MEQTNTYNVMGTETTESAAQNLVSSGATRSLLLYIYYTIQNFLRKAFQIHFSI